LIQYAISAISGKPVLSNEPPRTYLQSLFFWFRVAMSVTILCFSFAVTVVALFEGKTTMWSGPSPAVNMVLFFIILSLAGMLEALQISFIATAKMRKELRATSYMGKKTVESLASNKQKLPSFLIGRQLMVVSCFFILARMITPDVKLGQGQNIFGVSDGFQSFLNTGMHAALLTTILGSSMETNSMGVSCWFHELTNHLYPFVDRAGIRRIGYLFRSLGISLAQQKSDAFEEG